MSTAIVRKVVGRFLRDSAARVLVIRGKWGVGKTYFWRSCIANFYADSARRRYSYVSLFGLSSIKDLYLSVLMNARAIDSVRDPSKSLAESKPAEFAKSLRGLSAKLLQDLPGAWGKTASVAIESLAPYAIRDLLVCFDDFERLPQTGIHLEEILGFVSSLKEEKNCKVVLIFNDEELRDKGEVYRRYREKTIDVEVLFEPTVDEAAELALPPSTLCFDLIRQKLRVLGIRNIRLMHKILSTLHDVEPLLRDIQPSITHRVAVMVVLLTWAHYDSAAQRPPLEFIRKWNSLTYFVARDARSRKKGEAQSDLDKQMQQWEELLNKFELTSFDGIDDAVDRVITTGYVEGSGLTEEIAALSGAIDASEAEARFTAAWRLYHDSLGDDEAEIVAIVDRTFDDAAKQIAPVNLDSTVSLLRNLGHDELADDILDRYIRIRGAEPGLFDPENLRVMGAPLDQKIIARFATQFALHRDSVSLAEALEVLARHQGYSPEHVAALLAASADDFYQAFKSTRRRDLEVIIKACLEFKQGEEKAISDAATSALKRIAAESRLNRLRIKNKYGIDIDGADGSGRPPGRSPLGIEGG